jgi:hypothetical protein
MVRERREEKVRGIQKRCGGGLGTKNVAERWSQLLGTRTEIFVFLELLRRTCG